MFEYDSDPGRECHQAMDGVLNDDDLFLPLYSGAEITVCGAYCCIMQYATSKKLSYTAIDELLKLLHTLMPNPNHLPSSFYKFKKFFERFSISIEHDEVCSGCYAPVEKNSECSSCADPNNPVLNPVAPGHLIRVPIHKAVQTVVTSKLAY